MTKQTRIPAVDAYINRLPLWQQAICSKVRDLMHDAEPEIEEVIKRRVQPYFIYKGNVAALLAAKDHVNVFIYDPIAQDPSNLINQGHGNSTARAIQLYENDTLDEKAFISLIKAIVANNKAGGWRKLQSN